MAEKQCRNNRTKGHFRAIAVKNGSLAGGRRQSARRRRGHLSWTQQNGIIGHVRWDNLLTAHI